MSAPSSYNVLLVRADGVEDGRDAAVSRLAEHFRLAPADAERIVDSVPVVVRKRASDDESRRLVARLREMGFEARRIPAGDTNTPQAASNTGILKPVRRRTGEAPAVDPSAPSARPRRDSTGRHEAVGSPKRRLTLTSAEHVTVHTNKDRLRRLSGQFSAVSDAEVAARRAEGSAEEDAASAWARGPGPASAPVPDASAQGTSPFRPVGDTPMSGADIAAVHDAASSGLEGMDTPLSGASDGMDAPGSDASDGMDAPGSDAPAGDAGVDARGAFGGPAEDLAVAGDAEDRAEPQITRFERGPLDVDVDAPTLAPSSALDGLLTSNDAAEAVPAGAGPGGPSGGPGHPASTPSPTGFDEGAGAGLEDTGAAFELTGNRHEDTPEPAGGDAELTRALDEIAADLPSEHPWPDVTGLSEVPVQTPRGPAPPPPVFGASDPEPDASANLTDLARRSSVLDEMMAIGDDDDGFAGTPSIEDVIAGNAPIPSAPRHEADPDEEVPQDERSDRLTHTSLEDSLSDISGAQERGSTAPTPAVGAGRITGPTPRVPDRSSTSSGSGVGLLIVAAIVLAVGGIGAALWWTVQERSSDAWRFEQAPRHYEQVEMIDGVRASSACAVLEPGRELCRYSSAHVASWFPDVETRVIEAASEVCYATAQTTSTDRRVVFDCTVRVDGEPERETWSLVHEHTRECSAPPGGLQQGESAECVDRIERRASRDGTAAVAPFTDQRTSTWTFDRLRESFSTNVGYFRVAELRVRPTDAASGLPVLVAWALDIDRVVERYRPDGTMLEEIVYIHEPTRRVGSPTLSPVPADAP